MAPMNASTPPPAQARRNHVASGIAAATAGERKRMPPPMTLATMMAAASNGPRRRSRTWGSLGEVVCTRGFNHEVHEEIEGHEEKRFRELRPLRAFVSFRQQLSLDWKFADLGPRARAVASEQIHLDVNELLVLQHVRAGLGAGIAARASHDERTAGRPARKAVGPDAPDQPVTPGQILGHLAEDGVDLNAFNGLGGDVLEVEADAGNQLVLTVDKTRVVPAGLDVGDLEDLLDLARPAAGEDQNERQ